MRKLFLLIILGPLLFSCGSGGNHYSNTSYFPAPDDFPRITIKTENSQSVVSKDDYVNAHLELSPTEEFEGLSASLRIRGRGHSTWNHPKKPYQIKFDEKQSIMGMAKDKKWILLANHSDKSLLRNELAFDLGRLSQLGWTPDSRFVELVINREYLGLYQIVQKVEESSNRVDIGDEGFLLEVDKLDRLDPDDVYFATNHYYFNIKEPDLAYDDAEYTYIRDYVKATEAALLSPAFLDTESGYAKYIDMDSFIDWYLINEIAKNQDAAFHSSVYMNIVPGGKLKMGPIWDFDIGFGNNKNTDTGTFDPEGFWVKRSVWLQRMFEDPLFVSRLKQRFLYFKNNRALINEKIITNADYLDAAQTRNYTRWQTLGVYVWPNPVYFDTYEEEVDYLMDWLDARFEWLEGAISTL